MSLLLAPPGSITPPSPPIHIHMLCVHMHLEVDVGSLPPSSSPFIFGYSPSLNLKPIHSTRLTGQ